MGPILQWCLSCRVRKPARDFEPDTPSDPQLSHPPLQELMATRDCSQTQSVNVFLRHVGLGCAALLTCLSCFCYVKPCSQGLGHECYILQLAPCPSPLCRAQVDYHVATLSIAVNFRRRPVLRVEKVTSPQYPGGKGAKGVQCRGELGHSG